MSTLLSRFRNVWPASVAALLFVAVGGLAASCVVDGDDAPDTAGGEPSELSCDMPRPGCPCNEEGQLLVCGEAVGEAGPQIVCGKGTSACEGGTWAACDITGQVTLAPGLEPQTQGPGVKCADPCDPNCHSFNDDPNGESGTGVVPGNGGLTLPGSNDPGGGVDCSTGVSGTCAHTICMTGGPLAIDCDAAPQPVQASAVTQTVFSEPFNNNNAGWSIGTEWSIGGALSSSGHVWGSADPSFDANGTANGGIAGVIRGGNATTALHGYYWLTSPVINTSTYDVKVELQYKRWLNSDYPPWMINRVEVFNGSSWVMIWESASPGPTDSAWQSLSHDVTAYKNANFRVRFGHTVASSGAFVVSSWNLDDVGVIGTYSQAPPPPVMGGSCVTQVCQNEPGCCSSGWTQSCVDKVNTICNVDCLCTTDDEWIACYSDAYDHDGDGYAGADGDCMDCDPLLNAGAYDWLNGIDDDCDGVIDNEIEICDANLGLSTTNIVDHAKAIDICRQTTATATGANRTWGLIAAQSKLVQADNASNVHLYSHGIMSQFGSNNLPKKGTRLGVYSSGTARYPGQTNYVNPNGQVASFNQGVACAYPPGFPQNAAGCPNGWGGANDSSGPRFTIRAPTNAQSFGFNFHFFSSEYPEWVCTAYNDHFVALLNGTQYNGNISFDANNNPVSVNVAFFTIPGCATCNHPILTNTGFDGSCGGQICGGSSDWLYTTAPITAGETLTIHWSTWDMSDHVWDSTTLIDNWTWSPDTAAIKTVKQPPAPPPTTYTDGYYVRDYDATGLCPSGLTIKWTDWSWQTTTPGDSYIDFDVQTATTSAGLGVAPQDAIQFTDPPGPAAQTGNPAVARTSLGTNIGSALVDKTLQNNSRPRTLPFLRVITHLAPSSDQLQAPTLLGWNMKFTCQDSE